MFVIACTAAAKPKSQDVFFCEVGLTGGCGFVLGDQNNILFNWVEPLGGGFLKYKFNGHYELRLQADGGFLGIKREENVSIRTNYVGLQVLGEFNFFNYGVKSWEAYRTWVTPSIMVGVGMIVYDKKITASLPMGIGAKFKLSNRVNMGLYWTLAKVFSDKLDYVDDPIGLNRGFWNNRDWYSTAQIYISFNFAKICAPCHDGVVKF